MDPRDTQFLSKNVNVGKCSLHVAIGNTATPRCEANKLRNDSDTQVVEA